MMLDFSIAYRKKLFCCGVAVMLALPPYSILPGIVGIGALYYALEQSTTRKRAFAMGWWFGFGYFVPGLYWISHSLLVDPLRFAWLIPFSLTLIPAICAIFTGLAALLFYSQPIKGRFAGVIFALLFVLFEYIRGEVTQFPWNYIGYIAGFSDSFAQLAYSVKIYGMSFIIAVLGVYSFQLLAQRKLEWKIVTPMLLLVAGMFIYGEMRLSAPIQTVGEALKVRIVQGNVEQLAETTYEQRLEILQRHIELSRESDGGDTPDVIIWPESAVHFILDREPLLLEQIATVIPSGAVLIAGSIRMQGKPGEEGFRYWNSAYMINDRGEIIGVYDKNILVPFGEYVPFSHLWPFMRKITEGLADFNPGSAFGEFVLKDENISLFPLICYEASFPDYIAQVEHYENAGFFINITNDAWFGESIGPVQHYIKAKFRAIESGIPLIRAANTGISAAFDQFGRELISIPLNQRSVVDIDLYIKN